MPFTEPSVRALRRGSFPPRNPRVRLRHCRGPRRMRPAGERSGAVVCASKLREIGRPTAADLSLLVCA